MLKFKGALIPVLCLVVAVAVLFGKSFVSRDRSSSPGPIAPKPAPAKDIITLHYHERPPYYVTGPLGVYGLCADPAKRVFKKAGIPFRWEKTPAKRQLDILRGNSSRDCLIGWFKNPEREKFAKYSLYIYLDKPAVALTLTGNRSMISGRMLKETFLNDNLTLLRKNSYSYGRFIDAKIAEFNPMQEITNAENIGMLKMIHSGRADYFFISEEEAAVLTTSSGLPKSDFKYIRFSNMPEGNKRYLLFSKKVEDEVIDKINAAIRKYVHPKPEV